MAFRVHKNPCGFSQPVRYTDRSKVWQPLRNVRRLEQHIVWVLPFIGRLHRSKDMVAGDVPEKTTKATTDRRPCFFVHRAGVNF